MRLSAIAVLLLLAANGSALGYWDDYGPFEKDNVPKVFPIHKCKAFDNGTFVDFPDDEGRFVDFSFSKNLLVYKDNLGNIIKEWKDDDFGNVFFSVEDKGEKYLVPPTAFVDASFKGAVYWSDLNGDGKNDYIIEADPGGQGIGGAARCVAIVLSAGNTYTVTILNTYFAGPNNFIDIFKDGKCEVIQTTPVLYYEQGKGGNKHSYWVYNLLEIDGDKVKIANNREKLFPKWVMWTLKPNHKETEFLTVKQKHRLWKKLVEGYIFEKPGK